MRIIDADKLINNTDDRYSLGEIGRRERDDIVDALEYAPIIKTKQIKYFDEEEKVWKTGEVIVSRSEKPNNLERSRE